MEVVDMAGLGDKAQGEAKEVTGEHGVGLETVRHRRRTVRVLCGWGSVEARELYRLHVVGHVAKTRSRRRNVQPIFDPALAETPVATLTDVEREIAHLIADGLTNQAIADRLGLARLTVSQHVATLLWRLDLRGRHEIAAWAIAQDRRA
jgi:DNA-binding CsgD family transcriptional regulator